jgi:hypothetical protein
MPEYQEILPAPEELEGVDPLTVDPRGIYHSPPSSETYNGGGGSFTPPKNTSTGQHRREEFVL